ncbi:MAG TPA: uridine kinase [Verrucomicrobiae bacterium]|nr:uridine kinase [Verrucomicrobiae bacterium]
MNQVGVFVAIVGGSGAGKSWLAERLQQCLGKNCARIALDDFYCDRSHLPAGRRERINYDHPRAIDWRRVLQFLRDARAGRTTFVPQYDFKTHARLAPQLWDPKAVVIFEGLWLLTRPAVRRHFDLSIFLNAAGWLRLRWRTERDVAERGRSPEMVRRQFISQVGPMHIQHVAPQRRWADIVLKQKIGKPEIDQVAGAICGLMREDEGESSAKFNANDLFRGDESTL